MVADLNSMLQKNLAAYAIASEAERIDYASYVEQCRSDPMAYVSEFSFKEWLEAGKPTGK